MCGIWGIVGPQGAGPPLSEAQAVRLRDLMADRGPDEMGLFSADHLIFGHRRLAIRDAAAGKQPWLSDDRSIVLVFNGELYNDRELRMRLAGQGVSFRTRCDTETLLHTYRRWGADCCRELRGDFAFGLYDLSRNRLLLARDRCGVKPLFYSVIGESLIFASSVSAIRRHPAFEAKPNWRVLSHYLTTLRLTLGCETAFEGIYSLEPGQRLIWDESGARIEPFAPTYTELAMSAQRMGGNSDLACEGDELEQRLRQAVRVRAEEQTDVGLFLSGGLDSSLIARMAHEDGHTRLPGVCGLGEREATHCEESDFAVAAARAADCELECHTVSPIEYQQRWQSLVEIGDLPLSTPSDVIIAAISERLKRQTKVALGGEGADELFSGYQLSQYSGHDFDRLQELAAGWWTGTAAAARLFLNGVQRNYGRTNFASPTDHYFALHSLIPAAVKPHLLTKEAWNEAEQDAGMHEWYDGQFAACGQATAAQALPRVLYRVNLESLLFRLDRTSMSAGLEVRPVFTDEELVAFGASLPESMKVAVSDNETMPRLAAGDLDRRGSLQGKRVLRQVAGRLLPSKLAVQSKRSFPTPLLEWLSGPWSRWAGECIRGSAFLQAHFRPQALAELTGNPAAAGLWLWPLLNLAMWGDRQFR